MAIGDTLNLVTNGSFEQKMNLLIQTINTNAIPHNDIEKIIFCLQAIANSRAATQKDEFKMDSLYTVQAIVRLGLASQLLTVGDQFMIDKGDTSYAYDIIDYNNDIACDSDGIEIPNTNTLTIQMHDCLPNSYYFDASGSPKDHWSTSDLKIFLNTSERIDNFASEYGFLKDLDPALIQVTGTVLKATGEAKQRGWLGLKPQVERFFLPSKTEVTDELNTAVEANYKEGSVKKTKDSTPVEGKTYYEINASGYLIKRNVTESDNPVDLGLYEIGGIYSYYSTAGNIIKKVNDTPVRWWTRSTYATNYQNEAIVVDSNGGIGRVYVYDSDYKSYVSPICVIY